MEVPFCNSLSSEADFVGLGDILDPSEDSPCKNLCNKFEIGNLMDFDAVYQFGKKCDIKPAKVSLMADRTAERKPAVCCYKNIYFHPRRAA